jgi:hypothetical protein
LGSAIDVSDAIKTSYTATGDGLLQIGALGAQTYLNIGGFNINGITVPMYIPITKGQEMHCWNGSTITAAIAYYIDF